MNDELSALKTKSSQGSPTAQLELGWCYMTGKTMSGGSCEVNYEAARTLLLQAHQKGVATASFFLAQLYERGQGGGVDKVAALSLYVAASRRGDFLPHLCLARLYADVGNSFFDYELARHHFMEAIAAAHDELEKQEIERVKPEIFFPDTSS
jgi:TPR repeat protein